MNLDHIKPQWVDHLSSALDQEIKKELSEGTPVIEVEKDGESKD